MTDQAQSKASPCAYCQLKALERAHPERTITLEAVVGSAMEGQIVALFLGDIGRPGEPLGFFTSIPLRCVCGSSAGSG